MNVFDRSKVKEVLKPIVESTYKAQKEEQNIYANTLDCSLQPLMPQLEELL